MASLDRTVTQRAVAAPPARSAHQYLTFSVAGETFATPIATIREILEHRELTTVPMMPSFMRGVTNLRGRVVPVIDLGARFHQQPSVVTRRSCFVILELVHEDAPLAMGVLVDAVSAVVEIADADIEPPPDFGVRVRADFITGMGRMGERFVIMLDIQKVLSVEELSRLELPSEPHEQGAAP